MTQLQRFPSPAEAVAIDVLQLMRFSYGVRSWTSDHQSNKMKSDDLRNTTFEVSGVCLKHEVGS